MIYITNTVKIKRGNQASMKQRSLQSQQSLMTGLSVDSSMLSFDTVIRNNGQPTRCFTRWLLHNSCFIGDCCPGCFISDCCRVASSVTVAGCFETVTVNPMLHQWLLPVASSVTVARCFISDCCIVASSDWLFRQQLLHRVTVARCWSSSDCCPLLHQYAWTVNCSLLHRWLVAFRNRRALLISNTDTFKKTTENSRV